MHIIRLLHVQISSDTIMLSLYRTVKKVSLEHFYNNKNHTD